MELVTVTAVIPKRGSSFTVTTDHMPDGVTLDYELIYCRGIAQGRVFTLTQWEEILEGEMQRNARNIALGLLTGRDMTSGALYKKLIDHSIPPQAAAKTVARCIELGEINDRAYAMRAAKYCLEQKRYGSSKAYQWMLQKGIPKEEALAALQESTQEVDTTAQIKSLIEKRYAEKLQSGEYRQKQNVIAALARRGYRIYEIQTAITEYLSEQE